MLTNKGKIAVRIIFSVFATLLVLKLSECNYIKYWSWWYITSPLWVTISFILGYIILFIAWGAIMIIVVPYLKAKRYERNKNKSKNKKIIF